KKCFHCFRLTHEKAQCPLLRKNGFPQKQHLGFRRAQYRSGEINSEKDMAGPSREQVPEKVQGILEGPPGFPHLFPDLSPEEQKSAMMYISHADPTERLARIERVHQHIGEQKKNDANGRPRFTVDLLKGKGLVYNYDKDSEKLKSISTHAGVHERLAMTVHSCPERNSPKSDESSSVSLRTENSTGFCLGTSGKPLTSGVLSTQRKSRNRPPAWKRRQRQNSQRSDSQAPEKEEECIDGGGKRKAVEPANGGKERSRGGGCKFLGVGWFCYRTKPDGLHCKIEVPLALKVSELINVTGRWNRELLFETFTAEDAERIMQIKPRLNEPDSYQWGFTKTGIYTTRSGYHFSESLEACLYALLWATESMSDLHQQYVIFESSTIETRQMMMNPVIYPWLGPLVSDINILLSRIGIWRLDHVLARSNKVANEIASSVTSGHRYQSYIAAKGPFWLQQTLSAEAQSRKDNGVLVEYVISIKELKPWPTSEVPAQCAHSSQWWAKIRLCSSSQPKLRGSVDKEGSVFSLASLTDDDDDASSQCSSTRRVSLSAMSNVTPPNTEAEMSGDEKKGWKHVKLKHSPNEAALVSEIENLLREEERKKQNNELLVTSSESEQKLNNGTNAFKLKKQLSEIRSVPSLLQPDAARKQMKLRTNTLTLGRKTLGMEGVPRLKQLKSIQLLFDGCGNDTNNDDSLKKADGVSSKLGLEDELKEAAALEAAVYSVAAEHSSSMSKVHAPARLLARFYLHACKGNGSDHSKRACAARAAVSGLIVVSKAWGNDVPRAILSRGTLSLISIKPGSDEWEDPQAFLAALEKFESWIFSRIVKSVWLWNN
ncbi:hypothetical protein IGI04_007435, partial [Brassica rapa subsp. trilocularis]